MNEKYEPEIVCTAYCEEGDGRTLIKSRSCATADLSLNETNLLFIYTVVYFLSVPASDVLFPWLPAVWRSI